MPALIGPGPQKDVQFESSGLAAAPALGGHAKAPTSDVFRAGTAVNSVGGGLWFVRVRKGPQSPSFEILHGRLLLDYFGHFYRCWFLK